MSVGISEWENGEIQVPDNGEIKFAFINENQKMAFDSHNLHPLKHFLDIGVQQNSKESWENDWKDI